MAIIPPNTNAPLTMVQNDAGYVTHSWQRAFLQLFTAVNQGVQSGMTMAYHGATAPDGWVVDATGGLPALPGGMIWIKKS